MNEEDGYINITTSASGPKQKKIKLKKPNLNNLKEIKMKAIEVVFLLFFRF